MAGSNESNGMLEQYIDKFWRVYSADKSINLWLMYPVGVKIGITIQD